LLSKNVLTFLRTVFLNFKDVHATFLPFDCHLLLPSAHLNQFLVSAFFFFRLDRTSIRELNIARVNINSTAVPIYFQQLIYKMDPPAEKDKTSVTPLFIPRQKILLWGDSLSQTCWDGWGGKLAHRYQRRADVLNRGCSGYNSTWYLQLPDESHDNVALVIIWFGANDASLPEHNPHHYVPIADYQTNLKRLVQEKVATLLSGNPKVLLVTPPPVHHDQRFVFQKQRYGDKATGVLERTLENSGKYAEACVEVAKELGVPCLNVWQAFQTDDNWGRFLSDGLHFSPAGHDFVAQQILEKIQQEFPDLHVEPCPITQQPCNSGSKCQGLTTFGPYHDEIDAKNPSAAMTKAFAVSAPDSNGLKRAIVTKEEENDSKKPKLDAPE